jgi:putative RNA 2'-phosphotransferase
MTSDRNQRLSRVIAHALRHKPERYGLTLDKDGWVALDDLMAALAANGQDWSGLTAGDICAMAAAADKQRYEIKGGRIRARYGHSLAARIEMVASVPPPKLFHGTAPASVASIRRDGLRPMRRQYVHLSPDVETAAAVARRRTESPVIIAIDAATAHTGGVTFYRGNAQVWLAGAVPARYLRFPGE